MEKVKVGPHYFRACCTDECCDQPLQPCIVVGVNEDGTARLVVFEKDGNQSFLEKAYLAPAVGEEKCYYTESKAECDDAKERAGGVRGRSATILRTLYCTDSNGDMTEYQCLEIDDPNGTFSDATQGTCTITSIGPRFSGAPPVPPPVTPFSGPLGSITGSNIPWWWLAGQSVSPRPSNVVPSSFSAPPYYY